VPPDVRALLSIADRRTDEGRTIRDLFEDVITVPVDVAGLRSAIAATVSEDDQRIEAWQRYSSGKRGSPSPYLDGLEVGFYDAGKRHVTRHAAKAVACADFISREAAWVLERREVEVD